MALPFRDTDIPDFLTGEPRWKSGLGRGWKGTKLLGKGGHGVVGLWEWEGDPRNAPSITQVVVKMSECEEDQFPTVEVFQKQKIDEGITLRELSRHKSRHIVRQFGGNRLGEEFNEMGRIVRVFLEYCPGGDCDKFLSRFETPPLEPLPEIDLWALFHCMALGIMVMARGTEDVDAAEWEMVQKSTELVHFDIKPDNIFLGYRDDDHTRVPVAKIGDLGEAFEVKAIDQQDDAYGAQKSDRGMEYFQPPEEKVWDDHSPFNIQGIPLDHPRKGACSNIWQVGTVMNQLLIRTQKRFDDEEAVAQCTTTDFNPDSARLLRYPNHSLDLKQEDIVKLYSKALITLVMECLVRPPLHRPSSIELVHRTQDGLTAALAVSANTLAELPLPAGMNKIPYAKSTKWVDCPPAWNVDDTVYQDSTLPEPSTPSGFRRFFSPLPGTFMARESFSPNSPASSGIFSTASRIFSSPSSQGSVTRSRITAGMGLIGSIASTLTGISPRPAPTSQPTSYTAADFEDTDVFMDDYLPVDLPPVPRTPPERASRARVRGEDSLVYGLLPAPALFPGHVGGSITKNVHRRTSSAASPPRPGAGR